MPIRTCLTCGALISTGSRCPACREAYRTSYSRASWARAVKARDGLRCRDCGTDAALEAHHIVPLAAGGLDTIGNGVTLCKDCHRARHAATPAALALSHGVR